VATEKEDIVELRQPTIVLTPIVRYDELS
jgi:hypothetical protein